MKIFLPLLLFLSSICHAATDETQETRFSYSREIQRAHFSLGSELTSLSSSTGSLMGIGPNAGFEYGLTDQWSIGSNVVFAFQATGKPGALFYSGITGLIRYTFEGSALKTSGILSKQDGSVIFQAKPATQKRIAALWGIDQLFLNGVASIYPAVGMTLGLSYGTILFNNGAEFDIRYSSMTANDNPLSMIAVGAHFNLDF